MDPLGLAKIWRKLFAFAAGLLPLHTARERWRWLIAKLRAWPPFARVAAWVTPTRPWQAAAVVVRRFWWRDHSGDEIDFDTIPSGLAVTLRVALLFVGASLLLIPVSARWSWPPIPVTVAGFEVSVVSGITLVVALIGVAMGWGLLIAGVARTNLAAFVAAAVVMAWMMVPLGTVAPYRWPLLAVPAVLLWAANRSTAQVAGSWPRRMVLALVIGPMAALAVIRGAELGHWHPALGGPAAVATASVAGALLTLALLSRAGRLGPDESLAPDAVFTTAALTAMLAASWCGTSNAAMVAALHLHLSAVDGLLWVVWAFIGIGLVFKLLKETRALATAMDLLTPGRLLPAVGLLILAAVAVLGFAQYALMVFARLIPGSPIPLLLFRLWLGLAAWPDWYETLRVMRWVVLVGLALLVYLRLGGVLDRTRGMTVGYLILLTGVVVYEYFFELYAFHHDAPLTTGVLIPLLFVLWVMWLVYSVGLRLALGDSPRWSRAGRTGAYAGAVVLIVVTLHLSAIVTPSTMADRTFLQLFLACLHVGLPYYLWVYLAKRYRGSPVPAVRMFGAFVLGLLCQLPVIVLSKAAIGGWSWTGLMQELHQAELSLLAYGQLPHWTTPTAWTAIAAAVALGALLRLVALVVVRPNPLTAVAVFTGFGCGAVMPLTLPLLPTGWQVAIDPLQQHLTLTLPLATHHALHLVLALIVAHAVARRRWAGAVLGVGAAAALELALTALLLQRADYLAVTGLGWSVLAMLAGAAGLLLWSLERRLAPLLRGEAGTTATDAAPPSPPLVPTSHVAALAVVVTLVIAAASVIAMRTHRLIPQQLSDVEFAVPANWQSFDSPEVVGSWVRLHPAGMGLLLVNIDPIEPGQTAASTLAATDAEFAAAVEGFVVTQTWQDGPFIRRQVQFATPVAGGDAWPQLAEQILLQQGSLLLSWTVAGDVAAFDALTLDFDRVVTSVEPRDGGHDGTPPVGPR